MEPVETKLNLVIAHLEAERKSLKRMIKDAALERDNLIVYYHQEELIQLDIRLDMLYSLRDPDFRKKQNLEQYSINLKKYSKSKKGKNLRYFLKESTQKKIAAAKYQLQHLIDNPTAKSYSQTSHLENALLELFEKKIKSFRLLINEEVGFVLVFKMKRKILFIEFDTKIEFYEQDFILNERTPNPLKGFGFELNQDRKRYIRMFKFDDILEILPIKMWLSHFLIDYCRMGFSSEDVKLVCK